MERACSFSSQADQNNCRTSIQESIVVEQSQDGQKRSRIAKEQRAFSAQEAVRDFGREMCVQPARSMVLQHLAGQRCCWISKEKHASRKFVSGEVVMLSLIHI